MTTVTRVQVETPALDLDARLTLAAHGMDLRLDRAAVAFEVNTAHIEAMAVDFAPVVPLTPVVSPAAVPQLSPMADLLRRAHARILRDGWTTGHCRTSQAKCAYEAIRAEADTPGQAADACAVLLDTIRRSFPGAESVPAWNDQQTDPGVVLRMLDQATRDAEQQGL